ncbi:unnamed protein product [Pieris macdunnoughi]|uniref:Uncharacterized protein n=1 Tax=Pieris macdunnoughi TaxID=345717 RepID=A0A821XSX3_9NEOP|nr:unnamed protein product [Pieris macdunnoughi]
MAAAADFTTTPHCPTIASLQLENYVDPAPVPSVSIDFHSLVTPSHISPVPTSKKTTNNRRRLHLEITLTDIATRNETAIPTDEDAECFFSNGKYSEDKRGEVQCFMCELLVHGACSGYESGVYICEY